MKGEKVWNLCMQVTQELALHPDTMLQFSATQIWEFIESGMGILIPHPHNPTELAAFAKLYQWPGHNQQGKILYEFGSWVVPAKHQNQEFGKNVLHKIVQQGKYVTPDCQIIGVTEHLNTKPIAVMSQAGGISLAKDQWPSNLKIKLGGGKAQVVVIDVSNI